MKRVLLCLATAAVALEARPAGACGHPVGGASLGVPRLVSPAPGATGVPVDAEIVMHWIDCCFETDDPTFATWMHVRRAGETVDVAGVVTLQPTWGTPYNVLARPARFVAAGGFAPDTTYEVWATMPMNWSSREEMVATFTTGSDPVGGAPPATPAVSFEVGPLSSCYDLPELGCCGDSPLQAVDLIGAQPGLLYTLTTADGVVLAADAPAPVRGLASCAWFAGIDGTGADGATRLGYTTWWVSTLGGPSAFTVTVVARDLAGRDSPPSTIGFEATCAPAPPPDAGPGGDEGSGGCSTGGAPRAPWFVLAALLAVWVRARRTHFRHRRSGRGRARLRGR